MIIGVPKEIKDHEYRVALTPAGARELVRRGHRVVVQANAGAGIGIDDSAYKACGAEIAQAAEEVFEREKLKTKKPIFCLECGEREEVVKCGLCNLSLQRHQAKQVSNYPAAKNYHPHCLRERQKQMERLGKVSPIMLLAGFVVGGLIGWVKMGTVGAGSGAAIIGFLCYTIVTGLKVKLSPK
jgi:hypothetical protein